MADSVNKYDNANADATEWAKITRKKLALRIGSLTLKDRRAIQKSAWHKAKNEDYKKLQISLGTNFKRDFGQIYRINFKFRRHGIFMERGVGRHRPVSAPKSAKPWLEPILNPAIDELADIITQRYADIIVGELKINIPGIISRRVRVGVTNS